MTTDWYAKFHAMRAAFFEGAPQDVAAARVFYESIVGVPAIVRLTVALRLDLTEGGQDWAIEVADGDRLEAFLDHYERSPLDDEERYWLLELIVASLENRPDLLAQGSAQRERVRAHLVAAFAEHREHILYWARLEEPAAIGFAVTPMMREVWRDCARESGN